MGKAVGFWVFGVFGPEVLGCIRGFGYGIFFYNGYCGRVVQLGMGTHWVKANSSLLLYHQGDTKIALRRAARGQLCLASLL